MISNKELVELRSELTKSRDMFKNSIDGIITRKGIDISGKPFTKLYNEQLVATGDYIIQLCLRQINQFNKSIKEVDAKIAVAIKNDPISLLVKTIPGIDDYSALVISTEIIDIGRFDESHKLSAYAGLVPSVKISSDNTIHYGSITKKGSHILRKVMTECVHTHMEYAPDSPITEFYNRFKATKGSEKATVAAASKMLRVIHCMLREKKEFTQNYQNHNSI
jgi:transposase